MDLGTMVVTYSGNVGQFISASNQAKSAISGVADSAQSSGSGILGGFGKAISGAVGFASSVGQTIIGVKAFASTAIDLGQALLDPAEKAETMQTAFTTLLGSTSAANAELQKLDAFASKTPFQTMDIDQAASQLIGFGVSAQDTIPDLTAIGDALSAVGKGSTANLGSVVDIFGKIQTEGGLTIGTMQQMSRDGINAWAVLEKQTGKTKDQLTTMIQQGLFPAKTALDDLTKGIEKNPLYAGGMAKQSNTMVGIISTLKSNWDQMLVSFGSPIIKGLEGGLASVGQALTSPAFKSFAGGVGQSIANVFGKIGEGAQYVRNVLRTVNFSDFQQAWHAVGTAVNQVERGFGLLHQAIAPIQGDFDPIAEVVQHLAQGGLNVVSGLLWDVSEAFVAVDRAIQTGQGPLGGLVTFFKKDILPALRDVLPSFEHLGDVLLHTVAPAIEHMVGGKLNSMVDIFKAFAPIVKETLPPLIRFGGWLVNELANGLQVAMPYVQQITDAINKFGVEIAQRVAPIVKNWLDDFMTRTKGFADWWGHNWNWISVVLQGAWDTISGVVKTAWAIVSGVIKIGLDLLGGNWAQAWTDFKDMLSGVWDGIKTLVKGQLGMLVGILYGIGQNIADALKKPFEDAKNAIGGIGSWFSDRGKDASHGFQQGWGNVGQWFQDRGKDIKKTAQDIGTGAVEAGKWMYAHNVYWKASVDDITAGVTTAKNWITDKWTALTGWIAGQWNHWSTLARVYFTMISVEIQARIWEAITYVTNRWNQAHSWLMGKWNQLAGLARVAWQAVSGVFSGIWQNYIAGPLGNLWNRFSGWFGGIASAAFTWGSGIVQGIINGIGSKFSDLGNMVHNGIGGALGGLGFHGIPGFASGVQNFAGGLAVVGENGPELVSLPGGSNVYSHQNSMQGGTYPIRPSATAVASSVAMQQSAGNSTSGNNTYIFEVDGQQMARITQPHVDGLVRLKMGPRGRVA